MTVERVTNYFGLIKTSKPLELRSIYNVGSQTIEVLSPDLIKVTTAQHSLPEMLMSCKGINEANIRARRFGVEKRIAWK